MTVQRSDSWRPTDSLANRLYLVRREKRLSQRDAAELCGLTFGEWQSIEDGRSARGLDEKVLAIAEHLRVDRDWLMWGGPLDSRGDPPPGEGATPGRRGRRNTAGLSLIGLTPGAHSPDLEVDAA